MEEHLCILQLMTMDKSWSCICLLLLYSAFFKRISPFEISAIFKELLLYSFLFTYY